MSVAADPSFIYLVYPFVYEPEQFAERAAALDQATSPGRTHPLPVWQPDRFPQDDLLRQVADYLNPADDRIPTARLWRLAPAQQAAFGLAGQAEWCLVSPTGRIPFRVGPERGSGFAAQLALFHDGAGFLTVRADPVGRETGHWLNFAHYARFARGQRGVRLEIGRRVKEPGSQEPQVQPFFPEAAGGVASHPEGRGHLAEILDALLSAGGLGGEPGPWWREIAVPGQVIPFVGLFAERLGVGERPELLYRLRNFFHADQEIHPSPEDLRADQPCVLPYAEGQWFLFSLDGGAFLACDAPDTLFFRTTLPDHLRTSYFLLFLLALHQRFALMRLSEQVAARWLDCGDDACVARREKAFRDIRDSLFSFTARAHFLQVMQRQHHHRVYRTWLDLFQIADLFQEVRGEVQDMHEFLAMQHAEERLRIEREEQKRAEDRAKREAAQEIESERRVARLEQLLAAIAAVLGLPTLALTFVQAVGGTTLWGALALAAGAMGLGAVLYWGVRCWVSRSK